MKQSRVEALRAQALQDQAEKVGSLEASVASLEEKVNQILASVTEILESLQSSKPKGKTKDKEAPQDAAQ